jgi:YwiC-like protein
MLLLPFAVGVIIAGPVLLHLPLLVAWLTGYTLSYYALLAVKTHRPDRVAPQVAVYGVICLAAAAPVLLLRPAVWWFGPLFAVLLAVNVRFAARRDDRALLNDLVSVVQSCSMVPVALVVAGRPASRGLAAALVLLAYQIGSILFVKTMIRDRGKVGRFRASLAVHVVATLGTAAVAWPLGVLFAWLTLRAAALPGRALTPKQVGMIELVNITALVVAVPLLVR